MAIDRESGTEPSRFQMLSYRHDMTRFSNIHHELLRLREQNGCIVSELLFYIPFFALIIAFIFNSRSLLVLPPALDITVKDIRPICFATLAIRETLFGRWDRHTVLLFVVVLFISANARMGNMGSLVDTCVFAFAARDMNLRRLMMTSAIVMGIAVAFVFICSQIGVVPDLNATRSSHPDALRHFLGFKHPNTSALFVFGIVCSLIAWRDRRLCTWTAAPLLTCAFVFYYLTQSRTMLYVSVLTIAIGLHAARVPEKILQSRGLLVSVTGIVPLVAVSLFALIVFYNPDTVWMERANDYLSGRLKLGHSAYETCGLELFGRIPDLPLWDSWKLVDGQMVPDQHKIAVDCFYINMPLRCGVVSAIAYLALFAYACLASLRQNEPVMTAILIGIAVYAASENSAMYFYYIPAVMGLSFAFGMGKRESSQKPVSGMAECPKRTHPKP